MSTFLHIMVNYGNDVETEGFLQKCLQLKEASQGLFVIVNNSAKSSKDMTFTHLISSSNRYVKVINCADNPGYFPAAQRALLEIEQKQFKFVILSNTDLEILNDNFYEILLKMPDSSLSGAIAPSVRSELSQKECNPLYWSRPSKRKIHFLKLVYSNFFIAWIYHVLSFFKSKLVSEKQILSGQNVYAPHGCFIILTQNYFRSGGDFSHKVRLYGEEIALAERLRKFGLKVVLEPTLKVCHREKGTEVSWWHRVTLSKRTFEFKKEAAQYLDGSFQ
jgi:GT2 family glycosyltransferase